MTNQAMEARILNRIGAALKQRDEQIRAFITVGLGKLAEVVKHDIKQLIDQQHILEEKLNILATHQVEHIQQLEQRVKNLEERLVMVAGSGNSFPADPQRQ